MEFSPLKRLYNTLIENMKDLESFADEELVKLYKSNRDSAIIGILYKRYYHLVLGTCLKKLNDREQAKDETMAIFEKLTTALLNSDVLKFNFWIYSITNNACISRLRKIQSEQRFEGSWSDNYEELKDDTDYEAIENVEFKANRVQWAVEQLANEQATCIRLFYFEDKSYKEIAQITNMTDGTIKSHLQNGKRKLKILLSTKTQNE